MPETDNFTGLHSSTNSDRFWGILRASLPEKNTLRSLLTAEMNSFTKAYPPILICR